MATFKKTDQGQLRRPKAIQISQPWIPTPFVSLAYPECQSKGLTSEGENKSLQNHDNNPYDREETRFKYAMEDVYFIVNLSRIHEVENLKPDEYIEVVSVVS